MLLGLVWSINWNEDAFFYNVHMGLDTSFQDQNA